MNRCTRPFLGFDTSPKWALRSTFGSRYNVLFFFTWYEQNRSHQFRIFGLYHARMHNLLYLSLFEALELLLFPIEWLVDRAHFRVSKFDAVLNQFQSSLVTISHDF